MKRPFAATVWREGNWFVSQCLEIDIASQGATEDEALENLSGISASTPPDRGRARACQAKPTVVYWFRGRMQLNSNEEVLVGAFRKLPPAAAEEIAALVRRLAALAPNTAIDWSDSWSDSDLQEFTAASVRSIEAAEPEDSD